MKLLVEVVCILLTIISTCNAGTFDSEIQSQIILDVKRHFGKEIQELFESKQLLTQEIQELRKDLKEEQRKHSDLKKQFVEETRRLQKEVDSFRQQQTEYQGTKRQIGLPSSSQVAFSASLSYSQTNMNAGQDIVFDKALLNLGHAYYTHNGSFIAPIPGIYFFSSSIDATIKADMTIAQNGQGLAFMECEPWAPASQTVVVYLHAGDQVSVRIHSHSSVAFYGYAYCTFAGFLLHDLSDSQIVG